MAVGDFPLPDMHPVAGVELATVSAGIKTAGRKDVVLMSITEGGRVAGVFTQNAYCAAPVTVCKEHLPGGDIRFLLVNAGNANACTGEPGYQDALRSCAAVADVAGVTPAQVLPFSTGVIGEPLPMDKLLAVIPEAHSKLSAAGWTEAAEGIMTTDTRPKGASVQFEHNGEAITVTGIAKGSGMIKPNMATMLGYIATDAKVAQPLLDKLVKSAADQSFNRITVDGDTSTNDSCILVATGQTALPEIVDASDELYRKLEEAVVAVHVQLALCIVSDGEGATKLVTVDVWWRRHRRGVRQGRLRCCPFAAGKNRLICL